MFYNSFGWFVFYFQKLTLLYSIMLGHMQKVNHFWTQIKKPKMWVRTLLPRALQLLNIYTSKIQLVVYCEWFVLIGWSTTRLYVAKSAGFEKQWRLNRVLSNFTSERWLARYFFDQLVKFYQNNYSSRPNGLWVNSPFGLRPHGLLTQRPYTGSRNNC